MTAKELIASGNLEAYVLGALGEAGASLVRQWLLDGSVAVALSELERTLTALARSQAMPPPVFSVL